MELYKHHPLARVRIADYDVAQQAVLAPLVEEGHARSIGIVTDGVAYAVVQVVHKPTLLYRKYFVERPGYVKTYGVHLRIFRLGGDFLLCKPAFVRTSELKFVAVAECLFRAEYRQNVRQLHLAYARKLVVHLPLLHLQLLCIRHTLPLTTTAQTEMGALRLYPYVAWLHYSYDFRLAIAMLLTAHLQVYHIAGNGKRHEYHKVVNSRQSLAFRRIVCYGYVLQYW